MEILLRLPAGDLERSIREGLAKFLGDGPELVEAIPGLAIGESARLVHWCSMAAGSLPASSTYSARSMMLDLGVTVIVDPQHIHVSLGTSCLTACARITVEIGSARTRLSFEIPLHRIRYGNEMKLRVEASVVPTKVRDHRMTEVLIRAHAACDKLLTWMRVVIRAVV